MNLLEFQGSYTIEKESKNLEDYQQDLDYFFLIILTISKFSRKNYQDLVGNLQDSLILFGSCMIPEILGGSQK